MTAIMSGGYGLNNNDEKDYGNGFEFTRRKRWPQLLLQELVGTSLFCVKPVHITRNGQDGRPSNVIGWKLIYVSPSVGEMLGQKPSEVEGRDFFELVFAPDHPQLQNLLYSLIHPPPVLPHNSSSSTTQTSTPSSGPPIQSSMPHPLGKSQTTYARMLLSDNAMSSDSDDVKRRGGPVIWEIRAHATGVDVPPGMMNGMFGMNGSGTVNPGGQTADGLKGKAVWLVGRRVGEGGGESDNAQSLDAFLELKLENEKLREELKELQLDMDDLDDYMDSNPIRPAYSPGTPSSSSETPSETDSDASAPAGGTGVPKSERKKVRPKDKVGGGDKKRSKKVSISTASAVAKAAELGEGMHVCVTCGRTDSPEWRKGPLGPKTLCNACGLRWAKRNSSQPTRKDRKIDIKGNKK